TARRDSCKFLKNNTFVFVAPEPEMNLRHKSFSFFRERSILCPLLVRRKELMVRQYNILATCLSQLSLEPVPLRILQSEVFIRGMETNQLPKTIPQIEVAGRLTKAF